MSDQFDEIPAHISRTLEVLTGLLRELMRFRHFKRSCFELDYDRCKVNLLAEMLPEAVPLFTEYLDRFSKSLGSVLAEE